MNTRKLIEGLYRQKFLLQNELKVEHSPAMKELFEQQLAMIDELLIEFFGE